MGSKALKNAKDALANRNDGKHTLAAARNQ